MPALIAVAALAAVPASASAATWSAPTAVTSSGVAYGPEVALGSPDVAGITYVRSIHGQRRVEYRRAVGGRFKPIVIVDRMSLRPDSPAITFPGANATIAWVSASRVGRSVFTSFVTPRGNVSPAHLAGGTAHQYDPRFPDPRRLLFNTRTRSSVAVVVGGGEAVQRANLPLGATFDATVAVLPSGDVVALWTDRGRVYTARETAGTTTFSAAVRVSALPGFARDPHLVVTTDGSAVALWRQSHGVSSATLAPGATAFGAPRELVPATEFAEGLSAIATSAGDIAVTYVSSPGDSPAGELRAFRVGPATPPGPTSVVTRPGERAREATLAADSSAAWAAWTTAGQGITHAIRVARLPLTGAPSAPRTLSGRDRTTTTAPAFALTARGRGIVAWATSGGQIRAVTRTGL